MIIKHSSRIRSTIGMGTMVKLTIHTYQGNFPSTGQQIEVEQFNSLSMSCLKFVSKKKQVKLLAYEHKGGLSTKKEESFRLASEKTSKLPILNRQSIHSRSCTYLCMLLQMYQIQVQARGSDRQVVYYRRIYQFQFHDQEETKDIKTTLSFFIGFLDT